MSGVIDDNGQQWEHCNGCEEWVKLEDLGYLRPSKKLLHGADLCVDCVDFLIRTERVAFEDITPADSWQTYEAEAV